MPPKTRRRKALEHDSVQTEEVSTKKTKRPTKVKNSCSASEKDVVQDKTTSNDTSVPKKLKDVTNKLTESNPGQCTDKLCTKGKPETKDLFIRGTTPMAQKSCNFLHLLSQNAIGMRTTYKLKQSIKAPVKRLVSEMMLYKTASLFDRRCTAVEWHPLLPNLVAVGSKGGDIILWDIENNSNDLFIQGKGAGGSIQAVKFLPGKENHLVTASIDGTVTIQDVNGRHSQILLDTMNCHEGPGGSVSGIKFHPLKPGFLYTSAVDGKLTLQDMHCKHSLVYLDTMTWDYWYCSLDLNQSLKQMVTGDNVGNVTLLSMEGKKNWTQRLHKQKVTHVEFSSRDAHIMCTASTDQTVKVWDLRNVKDKNSSLSVLKHNKPINSAHFSLTDGSRLLTTDQNSEIRVYSTGGWQLEQTILHPHRFFQHITPIKACWHPHSDLVVIGRYPDPNFTGYTEGERRTVDILDSQSGGIVAQLWDPAAPGIVSLNKFNQRGDTLVSTMGYNILLWKPREELAEKQSQFLTGENNKFKSSHDQSDGNSSQRTKSRKHPTKEKYTKNTKKELATKTKLKVAKKKE